MTDELIGADDDSLVTGAWPVYTRARLVHRSFRIPSREADWWDYYVIEPPESDLPFHPHVCWMGQQYSRVIMTEFRVGVDRLDIGDGIPLDPFHCSRWPLGGPVDVRDDRFRTIEPGVRIRVTLNFTESPPPCEHWFMMTGVMLFP